MATCNIRLYGDQRNASGTIDTPFELQLGKNWVVDDLTAYLSGKILSTINNCQYIKELGNLTMTLKLDLPQEILEMGIDGYKFIRYIGLQNSDTGEWFYYFVTDYERLSENCINFILVMDSLNSTLSNVSYKRKLEFTDKTNITREHVDRFYQNPNGSTYLRNIPMLPEGINPPLYKTKSIKLDTLQQGDYSKNNWYLVYRTEIEPGETDLTKIGNPIKCYLLNDLPIKYQSATDDYTMSISEFKEGSGNYNTLGFTNAGANTGKITLANREVDMSNLAYIYIRVIGEGGTEQFRIDGSALDGTQTLLATGSGNIVFSGNWNKGHYLNTSFSTSTNKYEPSDPYKAIYEVEQSTILFNVATFADGYTKAFNDLDRTDSRLVKIICLPYCPVDYIVNSIGNFVIKAPWVKPNDWDIVDHMIQIKDINRVLEVDLSKVVSDDTANYKELTQFININDIQYDTPRFIPESKLYHSEFFQRTYFYDSFVYTVNLERMIVNPDDWRTQDLTKTYLTYQMTNGIKSTMMFSFPTPQECEWYESENYSKYLIVNRNNEVSMYDNAYLDYIRNGYNYDVKAKNRNIAMSALNMLTGTASSLLGFGQTAALQSSSLKNMQSRYDRAVQQKDIIAQWGASGKVTNKTYNQLMRQASQTADRYASEYLDAYGSRGIAFGFSGAGVALSVLGNIASGISSIASQEDQLQQTLKTKALQATSVENADDLDLLKAYSGNKLSVTTYKVLPEMQKYLSDLFYYTGSKVSYMGIPNTHKRLYFDFIQCNPIFKATYTYDNAVIVDVTSKLQEGVTFFHKVNNEFKFDQTQENWETWLIGDDN